MISLRKFERRMKKELPLTLAGRVRNVYKQNFDQAKALMLEEFESHPVTQEIDEGFADPSFGRNISGRLGGRGNLYAFIGFDKKKGNPLDPIRKLLKSLTVGKAVGKNGQVIISTNLKASLKDEIYSITPMPWASGRSWAKGIEQGIAGLGKFLRIDNPKKSRSGGGVQVEEDIASGVRYQNGPYLTAIINRFLKRINKL